MKNAYQLPLLLLLLLLFITLIMLVGKKLNDDEQPSNSQISASTKPLLIHSDWRLVRDISDVQVYMKSSNSSQLKNFLGKTIIQSQDIYAIAALFEDFENASEWMHMISDFIEIKRLSNEHRQMHFKTRLPWPLRSRDITLDVHISQDPSNFDLNIIMLKNDQLLPELPGYIRISEFYGGFRAKMLSQQRISIEFEFVFDPDGHTPPFLSNILMKDIAFYSVKKLKKMLQREEYQHKKSVYESWLTIPANYNDESYFHPDEF